MAFLKIRYKLPDSDTSTLITQTITEDNVSNDVSSAPREARFAAAVAGFGQLLRGGRYTGAYGYDDVIALHRAPRVTMISATGRNSLAWSAWRNPPPIWKCCVAKTV
jgi:hypothetical protein